MFGTAIACGLGLALGQAAVSPARLARDGQGGAHASASASRCSLVGLRARQRTGWTGGEEQPCERDPRGLRNVGPRRRSRWPGSSASEDRSGSCSRSSPWPRSADAGLAQRRRRAAGRRSTSRVHRAGLGAGRHRGHRGRARRRDPRARPVVAERARDGAAQVDLDWGSARRWLSTASSACSHDRVELPAAVRRVRDDHPLWMTSIGRAAV